MSNPKSNEPKKKRPKRFEWEINNFFQDRRVVKFPWSKPICGPNRKMKMVRCKICPDIERREKLLVLKLNPLIKHSKMRKCNNARLGL
jgi:hypothetical protein